MHVVAASSMHWHRSPADVLQVGVYATEKVFYDRVYMDQVSISGLTPLKGMVDVRSSSSVPPALPSIGAIVTYEQDWYALPPGRLSVIQRQRKPTAGSQLQQAFRRTTFHTSLTHPADCSPGSWHPMLHDACLSLVSHKDFNLPVL